MSDLPDSRRATDRDGWEPAFVGQRAPFEPGNTAAVKFGTRAKLKLAPRASEISEGIRAVVPLASASDDVIIDTAGMVFAQLERAHLVLGLLQARELERVRGGESLDADVRDDLRRLAADARSWANSALRFAEALALTPSSKARLGIDAVRMQRELTVMELHEIAAAEREDDA